ncbi:MAG: arginine decarboxylase, partial [Hyphomicrobiales bacterium]
MSPSGKPGTTTDTNPDASHTIYGFERWGRDLLTVLENGDVGLQNPLKPDTPPISLPSIIRDLDQRGVHAPLLLRVNSFLENEIRDINQSFATAMKEAGYNGSYRGVFPIKVNQQAQVIKQIVDIGRPYAFGLEAGSKPE